MIEEEQVVEQPVVVHDEPCPEPLYDEMRGTVVDTPYDAAFVQAVKDRWKHGDRMWDADSETWFVVEGNEHAVEELVLKHFGGCRVVHPDGSETLRDQSGDYEQGGLFT